MWFSSPQTISIKISNLFFSLSSTSSSWWCCCSLSYEFKIFAKFLHPQRHVLVHNSQCLFSCFCLLENFQKIFLLIKFIENFTFKVIVKLLLYIVKYKKMHRRNWTKTIFSMIIFHRENALKSLSTSFLWN
jgi:hypothetical protein